MLFKDAWLQTAEINEKIIEIWEEHRLVQFAERVPFLYPNLKKNSLLFIGNTK